MTPVSPKKTLGQHFLADRNILDVIARLAGLADDDVVLEIGPGLGVLTRYLADRVDVVHAVEIDRRLEERLRETLAGCDNVVVHWGDALRLELGSLAPTPTKLVANLPYHIATPLVAETITGLPAIESWCVMVQREVADRFFAVPETKAYGAVSVLVQLATRRTGWHPVSRHVFRPPPRVDSALVAFERIQAPARFAEVRALVDAAFAHRRKTLANSVALAGRVERERAAAALRSIGRDVSARAETLTPAEFVTLEEVLRTC